MIDINGNEFRTLANPIYLADGQRVLRVFANDKQVYPEINNPRIIKMRGSRTIHASHSHDGILANALYGTGYTSNSRINNLPDITPKDFIFETESRSFDITVSFCAVLKSEWISMLQTETNASYTTTDFRDYAEHIARALTNGAHDAEYISRYIQYGDWGADVGCAVDVKEYNRLLCPLYGVEPVPCRNCVLSGSRSYPREENDGTITDAGSIIDADILVSIQMTTPKACPCVATNRILRSYGYSTQEAYGKMTQSKTSFPEYSANNGIHRVHAVVNANPHNTNGSGAFPVNLQMFRKSEGFKACHNGQPAIGNGHITCGFPTFGDRNPRIRYLRVAGVAPDVSLSCEFPDWGSDYNFTDDRTKLHSTDPYYEIYRGSTLCEVPIDEFLYVGDYSSATPEQREPQLSDLT